MKRALIIGGGIAGLSSALYLSKNGYSVEVIEATSKFGGRINSFEYNGTMVDNGQHIIAECYTDTLELLSLIGAEKYFTFQDSLSAIYMAEKGESFELKIPQMVFPINNIVGFLKFNLLGLKERILVLKFLLRIRFINAGKINDKNVFDFLIQYGQTEKLIAKFWEGIVVSTMNTSSKIASAVLFLDMIKILFADKRSANLIIPNTDLQNAFITPLIEVLRTNGVLLNTSEKMTNIKINNNKIIKISTNKREINNFDFVISSIPERNIRLLRLEEQIGNIPRFEYSSIVTVHIWLNRNPFKRKMYNLINSEFDWLFNHGTHISLIKSNAQKLATINKNMVIKIAFSELKKYFTILNNIEYKDYVVLKEKTATVISNLDSIKERKSIATFPNNLYLVGDWTNTGLPPTIEGAIKSSKDVIRRINLLNFN